MTDAFAPTLPRWAAMSGVAIVLAACSPEPARRDGAARPEGVRFAHPSGQPPPRDPGDWPITRHDVFLSARQTLPGAMTSAPAVLARYETPRTQASLTPVDLDKDGAADLVLAFRAGNLKAYSLEGRRLWEASSRGVTYTGLISAADVDGDGRMELVLQSGQPGWYAPAAAVLDAATGEMRSAVSFPAGAFGWILKVGRFIPGEKGEQLLLINSMQVDPARAKRGGKGVFALWSFENGADRPRQRWFDEIPGFQIEFPLAFFEDFDGDGRAELLVISWCHLYRVDPADGRIVQHYGWDPQGANQRHYGWNQVLDVDGDGDLDFLCVAGTKHVDVHVNDAGTLRLAWTRGWPDEVIISKMYMAHAPWPASDLDGDGRPEIAFSLYNAGASGRWKMFVLDGVTGKERAVLDDLIPRSPVDLDGDGDRELLVTRHRRVDREVWEAVEVVDGREGEFRRRVLEGATAWSQRDPTLPPAVGLNSGWAYIPREAVSEKLPSGPSRVWVQFGEKTLALTLGPGGEPVTAEAPMPSPPPPAVDLGRIPADGGAPPTPALVADLDGNGVNEILLASNPAKALEWRAGRLEPAYEIPAECTPVIRDIDGDGALEAVVGSRDPDRNLRVSVLDGRTRKPRWSRALPDSQNSGVAFGGPPMFLAAGRYTGAPHLDVYLLVSKPNYRAMVLRGSDGEPVWTHADSMTVTPHEEGYGPFGGYCAMVDMNGDGAEDLLFASPSFLTCLSGRDASFLRKPRLVTYLLSAWAGYSSPVICPQPDGPPVIQLVNAWSTTGALAMGEAPEWPQKSLWSIYQDVREWRSGTEVVFRDARRPGRWRVAWPDHSGRLICREVETGKHVWTHALSGLAAAPVAGDVDGNGTDEVVVAGSDGRVVAIRDAGDAAEVLWEVDLGAPAGTPLLADVTGDGRSDLIVAAADGVLYVLGRP